MTTLDEQGFRALVDDLTPVLLRLARNYTSSAEAAQDAVQDTWLTVVESLPSFEGRSSLKTWVCGILVNKARRTGVRESRSRPFSSLGREAAVEPDRFGRDGSWSVPPVPWDQQPEERLGVLELRGVVDDAIALLPVRQRELITVRDVLGMSAEEAAEVLGLTAGNQRVLLHRARSKVRGALETYASKVLLEETP